MSKSRQFLIGASVVATALVTAPARAQTGGAMLPGPASAARVSGAALEPAVVGDAQRYMEEGKFKDARRVLRTIITEQRAAGEYPKEALQGLSRAVFALGDERATAAALDELAEAAGQFGDPETRLRSLFEATLIHQEFKEHQRVADNLVEIRQLLKSPVISEATRKDIGGRIPRK